MREWIARHALWLYAGALLLLFDIGLSSLAACVGGEQQQAEQCAEKYYGLTQAVSFRFISWVLGAIRDEDKLVVASATIVIAIFTITLWRSTEKMWRASNAQLDHSETTAERQLRAYVHVTDIKIDHFDDEWSPNITIKFQNYGQTPAYKVASKCSTSLVFQGKPKVETARNIAARYSDLGPGQHKSTTVILPHAIWTGLLKPPIKAHSGTFYVFGEITYFDAFQDIHADPPRRTSFRFELRCDDEGSPNFFFSDEGNEGN